MNTRAGIVLAGVSALALLGSVAPARAQELSENAVQIFHGVCVVADAAAVLQA